MNDNTVIKIREFNRFYLSIMNLYGNDYFGSHYSITESRVLYEIYEQEACNADHIVKQLQLDKGYISRIIKNFEAKGFLERKKSETDARSYQIYLTVKGRHTLEELIQNANRKIENIIQSLSVSECTRLEDAMNTIEKILMKKIDRKEENA